MLMQNEDCSMWTLCAHATDANMRRFSDVSFGSVLDGSCCGAFHEHDRDEQTHEIRSINIRYMDRVPADTKPL